MKELYFQCTSGISGDMTVAALLDLGANREVLEKAMESLHVGGYHLHIGKTKKCGIEATDFDVHLEHGGEEHHHHSHEGEEAPSHSHDHTEHHHDHDHQHNEEDTAHHHSHDGHVHPHEHRNFGDIVKIIQDSGISGQAKKLSIDLFRIVAEAESKAHGLPVEEVHFHEVGAIDSIVDIVATAVCLDNLGVSKVYCPYICEGQGTVRCQHGVMPVPVPAVVNIASAHGLELRITGNQGEMVTPTGAAIIAGIRTSAKLPEQFRIVKTGIGAGKKEFAQANILRVFEIETASSGKPETEEVAVLQSNIDDQSPETLSYAMEQLFKAGARDVWFEPICMKKNRPANLLNVLCMPDQIEALTGIILKETTSIGVRYQTYNRITMERTMEEAETEFGKIAVKHCSFKGIEKYYPEFESAKTAAELNHVSLEKVYHAIFKTLK